MLAEMVKRFTDLSLALRIQGKEVIQRPVVDATPLVLVNVGSCHGVGLSRARLSICKYADIVACIAIASVETMTVHVPHSETQAIGRSADNGSSRSSIKLLEQGKVNKSPDIAAACFLHQVGWRQPVVGNSSKPSLLQSACTGCIQQPRAVHTPSSTDLMRALVSSYTCSWLLSGPNTLSYLYCLRLVVPGFWIATCRSASHARSLLRVRLQVCVQAVTTRMHAPAGCLLVPVSSAA